MRYSVALNYLITIDYGNVLAKRFSLTVKHIRTLIRTHTHTRIPLHYVYYSTRRLVCKRFLVKMCNTFIFLFILHACMCCVCLCLCIYAIIYIVVECWSWCRCPHIYIYFSKHCTGHYRARAQRNKYTFYSFNLKMKATTRMCCLFNTFDSI